MQYGYPKAKNHKPKKSFNNNPLGGGRFGIIQELWVQYGYPKAKTHKPKQVSTITLWGGGSVWDYTGALGAVWLP